MATVNDDKSFIFSCCKEWGSSFDKFGSGILAYFVKNHCAATAQFLPKIDASFAVSFQYLFHSTTIS
jgi:hypothetical protein